MFTQNALEIFEKVITDYHIKDDPYQSFENPYDPKAEVLNHLLYRKCWIDTVQWHYEDIIRDPQIEPVAALTLKRQIDASNQDRTDMVEYIDSYFLEQYKEVTPKNSATINTESPAWGVDRLSILALKIYHMRQAKMLTSLKWLIDNYFQQLFLPLPATARVPICRLFTADTAPRIVRASPCKRALSHTRPW